MRVMQQQKYVMAIAGIVMLFYLVFHMLSNLSFFSREDFTDFYQWYNHLIVRGSLLSLFLAALLLHVWVAFKIRRVNAKARITDYQRHAGFHIPPLFVTLSITFLLLFIVLHIVQTLQFDTDKVYQETIALFHSGWMVLLYLAGLFVLTMHLQHALANVLQTLGKTAKTCQLLALGFALIITGGLAVIPLYSYLILI